ncbi:MAG: hypothetical protein H6835_15760 [Planctomycetes bacterium]|nr:hypothetical protein [Planctomycetota bacterium]
MPSAIRHDAELKDKGLVSILVEVQGHGFQEVEHFLWERFPDNGCMVAPGTFIPIPDSAGIPHGALIGVDGTLLWAGSPLGDSSKVSDLIDEQLKLIKKGWGDTPTARKVHADLYGKNNLASAAAAVAALPDGDEKTTLQEEVDKRYQVLKDAVANLQKNGQWADAQDAAKALQKAVGRHETWAGEAAALVNEFASEAAKPELDADKQLAKILKAMRAGKGDKAPKELEKLIEKHGQTSVGQRADRILKALNTPLT